MTRKSWAKPEVKKIAAAAAENGATGTKDGPTGPEKS